MLFISRHVGLDGFGVVDTDDGSEELIDRVGIVRADELGLKICGISHVSDGRISSIVPYQDPSTLSIAQTKLMVLGHIDVRTYNDAITYVMWHPGKIRDKVFIRLSDFGTTVEDCIFSENACSHGGTAVIIVDDKITSVSEFAFRMDEYGWSVEMSGLGRKGLGAIFDLREVEDMDILDSIYHQLDAYAGDSFRRIIDREYRKDEMAKRFGRS